MTPLMVLMMVQQKVLMMVQQKAPRMVVITYVLTHMEVFFCECFSGYQLRDDMMTCVGM